MLNIAHRGFSGKYPENTLLAFQKGIEAGADGFEFDTHLTKDGEIVIIHDERLDRTTNAQGFVKDYTLEELRKVDASKPFPECGFCGIPTLREYFELIRGRDLLTNIELKNGIFWYEGMEEKVIAMIREYGLEERVILSSFNHRSVMKCKALAPEIRCGFLTMSWLERPGEYTAARCVECYHPLYLTLDRETVDEMHGHGTHEGAGCGCSDRQLPGPCRCVLQGLSRSGSPTLGCAAEKPPICAGPSGTGSDGSAARCVPALRQAPMQAILTAVPQCARRRDISHRE